MIDLHCHSYFSDGRLSPEALVEKALQAGVQLLALTDHDTIAGLAPLKAAALGTAVHIINGIELSARWKKHVVHILGLNLDEHHAELEELITLQNECRIARAQQIADRLAECGLVNGFEKACAVAGHCRVGRPHFAQVLVEEGFANDMQAAFKRFLGRGRPAFVHTEWCEMDKVVETIVRAGGQAVIAHPLKYGLTRSKLYELIIAFKMAGGAGLEVVSGEMTVMQMKELAGLCIRFELLASSGSDFHADAHSRVSLGKQQPLPINCTPIWQQWGIK